MQFMEKLRVYLAATAIGFSAMAGALADAPPVQEPSSVEDIKAALFGGVPGDR